MGLAVQGAFDIVLMDIQMPEMDGYEASRRIRALLGAEAMPIIAVTAHASADERERCLAAGMSACITKPVELEMLYAELSKWIDPIDRPVPEPGSSREAPDAGTAIQAGDDVITLS